MLKKSICTLVFIFSLSSGPFLNAAPPIAIESEVTLDEITSPHQPRGTQNWEESQKDFFIFPGIVLTIIALAYFFTRD